MQAIVVPVHAALVTFLMSHGLAANDVLVLSWLQAQQEVLQLSGQSSRLPDHQAGHYSAHPPRSNTPEEELSLDQGKVWFAVCMC